MISLSRAWVRSLVEKLDPTNHAAQPKKKKKKPNRKDPAAWGCSNHHPVLRTYDCFIPLFQISVPFSSSLPPPRSLASSFISSSPFLLLLFCKASRYLKILRTSVLISLFMHQSSRCWQISSPMTAQAVTYYHRWDSLTLAFQVSQLPWY